VADSFESLNAKPEANCLAELDRKVSGHRETIVARLEADLGVFRPLPSGAFESCEKRAGRVSSTALVRYRGSDYSAPTTYGHRDVLVKGFVDQVIITCDRGRPRPSAHGSPRREAAPAAANPVCRP
jgi:hypothetical protein